MSLLESVRVRAYRSARDVELELGPVTALVGEARSGKSSLLAAVRALLDPAAPPSPEDVRGRAATMTVEARLAGGRKIALTAHPPEQPRARRRGAPPVLFLPAAHRSGPLLELDGEVDEVEDAVQALPGRARASRRSTASDSAGASALVAAVDACREAGITGVVFLIEEPELFLRPQTQRYLYRRLRAPRGRRQPGALHDPRARLPQRRPAGGARPRSLQPAPRDAHRPAGAARGRRGVQGRQRVRRRAERALPRALGDPRRGAHGEARPPDDLRRARLRRRPGPGLDRRVRRQVEHPGVRAHLQGVPDPLRRHPRPGREAGQRARSRPRSPSTA